MTINKIQEKIEKIRSNNTNVSHRNEIQIDTSTYLIEYHLTTYLYCGCVGRGSANEMSKDYATVSSCSEVTVS